MKSKDIKPCIESEIAEKSLPPRKKFFRTSDALLDDSIMSNPNLAQLELTDESIDIFSRLLGHLVYGTYLNSLRVKNLRKQDLPISSRVLNDWINNQKLLEDDRDNKEKWRAFSQIDKAYISILKTCRDFGISIRKLQAAKKSFATKLARTDLNLFEFAYVYFERGSPLGDIYMIMDLNGRCNVALKEDIILTIQQSQISCNFILNLTEIWNEK